MKWLLAIVALILETAPAPAGYDRDAARTLPSDRFPRMAYQWWQRASTEERLVAIGAASQGLREGWVFSDIASRRELMSALSRAYERKEVSGGALALAARPRPISPPVFTKPLEVYAAKVNDAYVRVPAMRKATLAYVLLCFSESKIIDCPDANGKRLR